jgi:2-dehydro-3-deoxygluconokinase
MRVLAFGELLLRLSPPNHLRIEQATSFDARYGGAEANVALSLALQGDSASYLSVIPANRIGNCALRSLSQWGVDVSRVIRQGDRLGTYYMEFGASERPNSVVYDRKYSAVSMAEPSIYDWDAQLEDIDLFYFSGVTPALGEGCVTALKEALAACRAKGITVACDLNYRGKLWSPTKAQAVMRELLPFCDVVIANDEDAFATLGISHGTGSLEQGIEERDEYVKIARDICATYGCRAVASVIRSIRNVDRSQWMAMLYDGTTDEHWYSSIHDVYVLEGVAADLERAVADGVSAPVVDLLEVVEIAEDDPERAGLGA